MDKIDKLFDELMHADSLKRQILINSLSPDELNETDKEDYTLLDLAIHYYQVDMCKDLIPRMNIKGLTHTASGRSPSRWTDKQSMRDIRDLIDERIWVLERREHMDPVSKLYDELTYLEPAEIENILCNYSAEKLNEVDDTDQTLLYSAIHNYEIHLCEALIPKMNMKGLTHRPPNSWPPSRFAEKQCMWGIVHLIDDRIEELEKEIFEKIKNAYDQYNQYPYEDRNFVRVDCTERNHILGISLLKEVFNEIPYYYTTPLHIALEKDGSVSLCKFIIDNSTDDHLIIQNYQEKRTVLHLCALNDNVLIANLLLPRLKNILGTQDYWGNTALYYAIQNNHFELSKILIEHMPKKELQIKNDGNKSPIDKAKEIYNNVKLILNMMEDKI